jgi:hypothetical protein
MAQQYGVPNNRSAMNHGVTEIRISWLTKSVPKPNTQPLHMTTDDWIRSLDDVHDTYNFESTLDVLRQRADSIAASSTSASEDQAAVDGNHIFSPGDSRIWHGKVKSWVQQQASCYVGEINPSLENQVHLVEALLGHGIIQDHDLRILAPMDPDIDATHPQESVESVIDVNGLDIDCCPLSPLFGLAKGNDQLCDIAPLMTQEAEV